MMGAKADVDSRYLKREREEKKSPKMKLGILVFVL